MIRRWISLVPSQIRSTRDLAPEALCDILAHVAAAAEDLHGAVGDAADRLRGEQLGDRAARVQRLQVIASVMGGGAS